MPDKADTAEENDAQKPPAKKKLQKRSAKKKGTKKKSRAAKRIGAASPGAQALYPRHSVDKALRIPKAILEQNAGKECSEKEAVGFLSLQLNGPSRVEINSGIKYGFLERPSPGRVKLTELGRKVLRPQEPKDVVEGFRAAVLRAPEISVSFRRPVWILS